MSFLVLFFVFLFFVFCLLFVVCFYAEQEETMHKIVDVLTSRLLKLESWLSDIALSDIAIKQAVVDSVHYSLLSSSAFAFTRERFELASDLRSEANNWLRPQAVANLPRTLETIVSKVGPQVNVSFETFHSRLPALSEQEARLRYDTLVSEAEAHEGSREIVRGFLGGAAAPPHESDSFSEFDVDEAEQMYNNICSGSYQALQRHAGWATDRVVRLSASAVRPLQLQRVAEAEGSVLLWEDALSRFERDFETEIMNATF